MSHLVKLIALLRGSYREPHPTVGMELLELAAMGGPEQGNRGIGSGGEWQQKSGQGFTPSSLPAVGTGGVQGQ